MRLFQEETPASTHESDALTTVPRIQTSPGAGSTSTAARMNRSTSAITEDEAAFLTLSQNNERINRLTPNRGVPTQPNTDRLILFMLISTIFNPITRAATIIRQGVSVKGLWLYHNFLMQKERVTGWMNPIYIGFHGTSIIRSFFERKQFMFSFIHY